MKRLLLFFLLATSVAAQGSRHDGFVITTSGRPVAGASIRVCNYGSVGFPCPSLSLLYSDILLSVPLSNPTQTDASGNFHFYALASRYDIQISGIGIVTYTQRDIILPFDSASGGGGGISSLNALTAAIQTFAVSTTGTDFTISSLTSVHTFNLPTASATNRGALSSTDWSAFNAKEAILTFSLPLVRTVNTITCPTCALTTNNLSSFAATTSAQLAGVLSDETGSGLAVFGTSPTIVTPTIASFVNATHSHLNAVGGGTLDAGAIVSGTFDNARINWSSPGNIGNVTPGTGAFTGLTFLGNVTFDSTAAKVFDWSSGATARALTINGMTASAGNGGAVTLAAGFGVGTSVGGALNLSAGSAGNNGTGGNVTISAGGPSIGTGTGGIVYLKPREDDSSITPSYLETVSVGGTLILRHNSSFGVQAGSLGDSSHRFSVFGNIYTTGSIGGGALLAGACTSGTVAVTAVLSSDVILATPVTYPGDSIWWSAYMSAANVVTVKVCAAVAATPTASNYNVRVIK